MRGICESWVVIVIYFVMPAFLESKLGLKVEFCSSVVNILGKHRLLSCTMINSMHSIIPSLFLVCNADNTWSRPIWFAGECGDSFFQSTHLVFRNKIWNCRIKNVTYLLFYFRVVELTRLPREIIYGSERLQVILIRPISGRASKL